MKRNTILIALFVASFMFPSIGTINTADARGEYRCETKDLNGTLLCLRQKLYRTPWGVTQPAGTQGSKNYGCGNSNSDLPDISGQLIKPHSFSRSLPD